MLNDFREKVPTGLLDVLKRPILVADAVWGHLLGPGSSLLTFTLPDKPMRVSSNVRAKMHHFQYFRANVRIKLVMNATPFMAGKLWLYFDPYPDQIGARSSRGTGGNLTQLTGYHGVEVDLSSGSMAEFVVPYISPFPAIDLVHGIGQMGQVYIIVLNSLTSGSTVTNLDYKVYTTFEDAELTVPTINKLNTRFVPSELSVTRHSAEQSAKSTSGVISGPAAVVSSVASSLSSVPVIGEVASVVSWAADIVGGVANVFGFSKPTSVETLKPFCNNPGKGYTNTDGLDPSTVLAGRPDNAIDGLSRFGTDADEMDIAFICKNMQYIHTDVWSTSLASAHIIRAIPVMPGYCNTGVSTSTITYEVTNMGYVAAAFKMWRGSLRYRFSFAKTAYHSGRIRVTWVPGNWSNLSPTQGLMNEASKWPSSHTKIYDLRETTEFSFDVPYLNHKPCLPVVIGKNSAATTQTQYGMNGYLVLTVENELRCPSSVAQAIQINTYMCGGDDISFMYPDCTRFVPLIPCPAFWGKPPLTTLLNETDSGKVEQHSGPYADPIDRTMADSQEQTTKDLDSMNWGTVRAKNDCAPEKAVVGEKYINLRAIIRRFGVLATWNTSTGAGYRTTGENAFDLANFCSKPNAHLSTQVPPAPALSNTQKQSMVRLTPIRYFSFLYRFYAGSRRYKIVTDGSLAGSHTRVFAVSPRWDPEGSINALTNASTWWSELLETSSTPIIQSLCNTFSNLTFRSLNPFNEVTVPYLRQNRISLISSSKVAHNNSRPWLYTRQIALSDAGVNGYAVMDAAGDDFSFGLLVGAPPLIDITGTIPIKSLNGLVIAPH